MLMRIKLGAIKEPGSFFYTVELISNVIVLSVSFLLTTVLGLSEVYVWLLDNLSEVFTPPVKRV